MFLGETIPDWALPERRIYEVPAGVAVQVGWRYSSGQFRAPDAPELTKSLLEAAVQDHLDARAGERGYDSIVTAATYADEPAVARYQSEGQAYRAWRSNVWAYCSQVFADVQAGLRPVPTKDQLIAEIDANCPLNLP